MRPQIRSIPLCKAECPQFNWVLRNNSENICQILQPEIHRKIQDERLSIPHERHEESNMQKHCNCIDPGLEPTLFPHPVTCVCSHLPCPPKNDKYRYCKLKISEPIGDVMQNIILDNNTLPSSITPPIYGKIMKRNIRSAHLPKEGCACVDCLVTDPTMLTERNISMGLCGCRGEVLKNPYEEDTWENEVLCTCQKFPRYSPKQDEGPDEVDNKKVVSNKPPRSSSKKNTIKRKDQPEKVKTPVKSPKNKSQWKKPGGMVCERLELMESNLYKQSPVMDSPREPTSIPIYEHFRTSKPPKSDSSNSNFEHNFSESQTPSLSKKSPDINSASTKSKKQIKPKSNKHFKIPWNWNNPSKYPCKTKKVNRSESLKKFDHFQKIGRSRAGDDATDLEKPKLLKQKLNTNSKTMKKNENDEVHRKDHSKARTRYGKVKTEKWNQQLVKNGKISRNQKEVEEINKEKSEFSEEDSIDEDYEEEQNDAQDLLKRVQQRLSRNSASEDEDDTDPDFYENNSSVYRNLEYDERFEGSRNEIQQKDRLSTIIEENQCCFNNECLEKPFFNVIKQRIHSRNRSKENLEISNEDLSLKTSVPDHTCVHRFTIDDRLFPKPLHYNESGTSCCIHCDKPMTSSEKSVFVDQRESKEKITNEVYAPKTVSKFSLKPVHMGAKNSVLEIKLGPEQKLLFEQYDSRKRLKKVFYPDSLALRHQRR